MRDTLLIVTHRDGATTVTFVLIKTSHCVAASLRSDAPYFSPFANSRLQCSSAR